jgi:hypothetical protein
MILFFFIVGFLPHFMYSIINNALLVAILMQYKFSKPTMCKFSDLWSS